MIYLSWIATIYKCKMYNMFNCAMGKTLEKLHEIQVN